MSEKRRAEIEAKRAKLAELRKARADRQKADAERRASEGAGPSVARRDVDDLVSSLIGGSSSRVDSAVDTPVSSVPGTPSRDYSSLPGPSGLSISGRLSRQSDVTSDTRLSLGTTLIHSQNGATENVIEREMTPRVVPDLIDIEQELFELPQKERVIYNKEVQTMEIETEQPAAVSEEEIRERIIREREAAEAERIAHEQALEAESKQLDEEIAQEIREMTEEERSSIFSAPEFLDFVEQSTKIIQRALNDNYDYIRDYTIGAESGPDASEGRIKCVCAFYDERHTKNRSITDIDWSPKYPELSCASYNKNPAALNEPDGIVAVWNLHLLERPEFVFHSQSDVLSVTFSPFHSNLIFGGTYSGQILLWDTRSKHLPVLKTPLSAAGHTHPVYAMQMVGTQNAHNLITSSTDGMVCSWLVDMLAQPQETLELAHQGHNKTSDVAITALNFPDNETTTFWIGTEEGNVYQANRYDRAGAKAGLNSFDVYKGHAGPVMGVHFHPSVGPVDFSDLFLTCAVDWTVKMWRARGLAAKPSAGAVTQVPPLYSFDEADDYVYDVRWHPTHPALFGTVDGAGKFDIWNLNHDTEVPVVSTTVGSGRALNKLRWERKDGRRAAVGGSDGRLYIYDIGDMALPRESEWTDMQRAVANLQAGGAGGGMAGGVHANGTGDDYGRIVAGR
ncbi:dynein intermediate chain [Trametes coccinea BRFM310]|uniref:Dynein intermediate chain n=1 Tax=Trametes coccinea (strain BRFM310) TaxID=1353009 RepID=A0A1Y2IQQ3_TRAC3|nr:dynein intermediate chain [Trametes coccinea BRFM310]